MTMEDGDRLTDLFEASRPRLQAVAYRMLGSHAEAEDAVQEAWLRVDRATTDGVDNVAGWMTTIVARICLDRLRSRRSRREEPAGMWPGDTGQPAAGHDLEQEVVMADSVGSALLVVLDLLPPAERVAFVLHDVFAVPFDEIGEIVGRSPTAARQLASRARRRVQGSSAIGDVDLVRQREVVDAFLAAARRGDFEALLTLLDPDVVLRPDATAVRLGSLRETRGAAAVAGLLGGGARAAHLAVVDGVAGLAWMPGGRVRGAAQFTIAGGRIVEINVVGDPDHLGQLDVVPLEPVEPVEPLEP
jgi:RNA polymerase sigma-70 factor (ECF subfamily)